MQSKSIARLKKSPPAISVAIFSFYLLIMIFRTWILRERIWAEDGLYIQNGIDKVPSEIFSYLGGYRQIPNRALAYLVAFLPPQIWALSIWIITTGVWATSASIIQNSIFLTTKNRWLSFLGGAAIILNGPASSDALSNLASLHHFLFGVCLILACFGNFSSRGWTWFAIFNFALLLDMPLAICSLIVIIVRFFTKTIPKLQALYIFTLSFIGILCQLYGNTGAKERSQFSQGAKLSDFTWEVMVAVNRLTGWLRLPFSQDARWKLFFALLLVATVPILAKFLREIFTNLKNRKSDISMSFEVNPTTRQQSKNEQIFLLAYSFMAVSVAFFLTSGIQDRHQVSFGITLSMLVLFVLADALKTKKRYQLAIGVIMFFSISIGNIREFWPSDYSKSGPKWSGELKSATEKCNTDPLLQDIIIQISPPVPTGFWIIKMKCERLRD